MAIWDALESVGTVVAAGIAGDAAYQSRASARESHASASETHAATAKVSAIESQRRHSELCPRLRLTVDRSNPGSETLTLRVALVGPPGLDRLDKLTAAVRNDHFRRGEGYPERRGGPTAAQIKQHIWGPYRFTPGTGPDHARADSTGRVTVYDAEFPLGEELLYQLEHTLPGQWMGSMSQPDWLRQRGSVIRLAFTAEHKEHGTWYLPCEIDTATLPATVFAPQHLDDKGSTPISQ